MNRLGRIVLILLYTLPVLFMAGFYVYPLTRILGLSLRPGGVLDLSGIVQTIAQPFFWRVLAFTFGQAIASTLLTLLLGMPLAYIFARYEFRGKSFLRALRNQGL